MSKKRTLFCFVVIILLAISCIGVTLAEDIPEEYPEIIEGLDFGGATVYINDWYSTGERTEWPTEEQQAQYDYWDWLEATYNVNIVEQRLGDWDGMVAELQNIVSNKDNSELRIVSVAGDFAGETLKNDLYMPWTYGLEDFNAETERFMTVGGTCYGVCYNKYFEPRQVVFFNKRVLENAGIDWNEIYDAQADGSWTWDKMESYMDTVMTDFDNDGELDIYALTGYFDDGVIGLVASNNGDFFEMDENGKLHYSADSNNTLEALDRIQEWYWEYYRPYKNWDDYKQYWPEGNVAFYLGQSYEGFNGNDVVNQIEDWGCVCLPKGPDADAYTMSAVNNVYGIPDVYDEETSLKLQQIYTLYRKNPLFDSDTESWAYRMYSLTDERAVEETYAYLRENGTIMNYNYLGDRNSTIGSNLTWNIMSGLAREVVEDAREEMEAMAEEFNQKTQKYFFSIAGSHYSERFEYDQGTDDRYYIMALNSEAALSFDKSAYKNDPAGFGRGVQLIQQK